MSESNILLIQRLFPDIENLVHIIGTNYPQKKVLELLTSESPLKDRDVDITECRVIDCIEKNNPINAKRISQKINITKSGISKVMSKLRKKELVNSNHIENNQREIYYSLTPKGKQVYFLHEEIYTKLREKYISILKTYSNEELSCIRKFINDMLNTL